NPSERPRSPKDRPDRVSERVDSKRLPTNGSRLEQRQPNKRTIETGSISLKNALPVVREPHEREVGAPRRVSNELNHKLRLAASPRVPASPALATHCQRGSDALGRREVIMARRSRAGLRDD